MASFLLWLTIGGFLLTPLDASARGGGRPCPGWWRRLRGWVAAGRETPVVHDRRLGERRRELEGVAQERRRGERRGPPSHALHAVASHLGAGSQWQGELHFRGVLRIDGSVAGPRVRGGALLIGAGARVQATIDVEVLQVRGQVQGEIRARQRVELLRGSRVVGPLWAPRVEIWPGAIIHGTVHLGQPERDIEGERTGRRVVGSQTPSPAWCSRGSAQPPSGLAGPEDIP